MDPVSLIPFRTLVSCQLGSACFSFETLPVTTRRPVPKYVPQPPQRRHIHLRPDLDSGTPGLAPTGCPDKRIDHLHGKELRRTDHGRAKSCGNRNDEKLNGLMQADFDCPDYSIYYVSLSLLVDTAHLSLQISPSNRLDHRHRSVSTQSYCRIQLQPYITTLPSNHVKSTL